MIVELPAATVDDLKRVERDLHGDDAAHITLQCLSDQFATLPDDVLGALNAIFEAHPSKRLRLYSAMDHRITVDLEGLRALPDLQHLDVHYGVPAIADVAPLASLTKLKSANLEVRAAYSLGEVLAGWPELEELSLIREGKASKAVNLAGLAGLKHLRKLYVMGYSKGISALKDCAALTELRLQSLSLPDWDCLPDHRLRLLWLNAVNGPDPTPFAALKDRAERLDMIRMDKSLPFDRKRAISAVSKGGWFTVDVDYLNGFHDPEWSGHDWAEQIGAVCPTPDGVWFDPEAGSLSVNGDRIALGQYQLGLVPAIAALLGVGRA
ncbi:hypothetical protein [Gymnodinialimonas hymeniacidonis]|uniref:hypothetical protein n=1 Tax=Gymnodinialimonas hymeniacidonis TaxID=3126508 RepID=UPI0034C63CFB